MDQIITVKRGRRQNDAIAQCHLEFVCERVSQQNIARAFQAIARHLGLLDAADLALLIHIHAIDHDALRAITRREHRGCHDSFTPSNHTVIRIKGESNLVRLIQVERRIKAIPPTLSIDLCLAFESLGQTFDHDSRDAHHQTIHQNHDHEGRDKKQTRERSPTFVTQDVS